MTDMRASWGVSHTGTAVGVYTDVSQGAEPVNAPLHNEIGQVIGQSNYDTHKTGDYTILVKAGVDLPAQGSQITIGAITGYVLNVRLMESNSQYQRAAVSIERYRKCDETTFVDEMATGTSNIH